MSGLFELKTEKYSDVKDLLGNAFSLVLCLRMSCILSCIKVFDLFGLRIILLTEHLSSKIHALFKVGEDETRCQCSYIKQQPLIH